MVFNSRQTFKDVWENSPVTFVLVVGNIVMFLLQYLLPLFDIDLLQWGALNRFFVLKMNEWYRIITAGFLHSGVLHLLFNVGFGLYVLSSGLERLIGSTKFGFIYFMSMILSGLLVVALSDYYVWTIGASGAIFGALGSLLYITVYRPEMMHEQEAKTIRTLIMFNLILTFVFNNTISIPGHIGGLLAGFLISYLFIPRNVEPYEIM